MLVELLLCTLIVWQAVEVYRHSTLFAAVRSRMDLVTGFFGSLHRCMWCLSVWVSFIVIIAYRFLNGWHHGNMLAEVLSVFGWGLAVSRASNLCNDYFHSVTRTPQGQFPRQPQEEEN